MEWFNDIDNIITALSLMGMVTSWLLAFLKAKKDKKTLAESVNLAFNTLKVEDKMNAGTFSTALVKKAEAAAEVLQVGQEAKQAVTSALKDGQTIPNDLKIGSINGQPIYLGPILGVGSALAAALRKIRGIRLRL